MTPKQSAEEQAKNDLAAMDAKVHSLFSSATGKEVLAWHRKKTGFDERVFVGRPCDPLAAAVKDGERCGHLLFTEAIQRHEDRLEGKKKQTKAKQ